MNIDLVMQITTSLGAGLCWFHLWGFWRIIPESAKCNLSLGPQTGAWGFWGMTSGELIHGG